MTESMIERVAKALIDARREFVSEFGGSGGLIPVGNHRFAKAAIKAMYEPTDAMITAALPPGECASYIDDIWKDMIEAALKGAE